MKRLSLVFRFLFFSQIVLAVCIGLFPFVYYAMGIEFSVISTKEQSVLKNSFWTVAFHTHIIFAGLSLLTGWPQFIAKLRDRKALLHKALGKIYIFSSLLSAAAGICIGFFATGGPITIIGFVCLGAIWFYTTFSGYRNIRSKKIEEHRRMMVYSYAACFAGVTLRIWLPLLIVAFGSFSKAYPAVAWLCWIPNLIFADWIVNKIERARVKTDC
jgi:uncharacterized membrane protein